MNQEEYIFPGAINQLEKVLSDSSSENVLLVRGKQSFIKSGAKEIIAPIYLKYNITEFSDFSVNPKLEEAQQGFDLFKKNKSQVIVAVGGGSVIDTAKIVKYLAIQRNQNNFRVPIVAIPSTAGTGSEATHFAVVYIKGVKHSFADISLLPRVALVDANLLQGQSSYQMAVSGLDAFSQGIESFWSIHSTEKSREYSAIAIKLLWENLRDSINGNIEARTRTAEGSNWAGKAINIAKTTAPHAFSYHLTKQFGIPHGHAVAIFLPHFITYNYYLNSHEKSKENNSFKELTRILSIRNENFIVPKIQSFIKDLGIKIGINDIGISKKEMMRALKTANLDRLKNNPRVFNLENFINETSIIQA